jgi:hypothetical protein
MSGKQNFKLEGLVVATVTPFQPCNLRLDEKSLVKYLQVWLGFLSPLKLGVKHLLSRG